jgi:hypothetical protein
MMHGSTQIKLINMNCVELMVIHCGEVMEEMNVFLSLAV